MRLQPTERFGWLPCAVAGDLLHRNPSVVVQNGPRRPAKVSEGPIVSFQKSLGVLSRKRYDEAVIGMRQIHALEVRLLLGTCDHHQRLTEIGLRVSSRMRQWHEYFLVPQPRLAHVILHHRAATTKAVLALQPVPHSLGGVPLLLWLRLVVHQDLVDDAQPRSQLRSLDRLFPFVARRQRIL